MLCVTHDEGQMFVCYYHSTVNCQLSTVNCPSSNYCGQYISSASGNILNVQCCQYPRHIVSSESKPTVTAWSDRIARIAHRANY